jgi:hypothetical protein
MPRIDLWAVDQAHNQIEDNMLNTGASNLASSTTDHKRCSEVWNALIEQMDSLLASVSISVLVSRLIYTSHHMRLRCFLCNLLSFSPVKCQKEQFMVS